MIFIYYRLRQLPYNSKMQFIIQNWKTIWDCAQLITHMNPEFFKGILWLIFGLAYAIIIFKPNKNNKQ